MTKYLFGDIVKEVKNKVDRDNNPYDYFIAGDHMDTDELHLLRRGVFAGNDVGPAFIRIFKPGQVLYGSRRTYLRKVAVADFEGVTANTTFVLESKDEKILLQRLLPFIMQADRFVQHSIKRSKGSTNPYVLFSDLADYEVELPDIDKQCELADLLWAMDDVRMSYQKLISATDALVKSQFMEQFGNVKNKEAIEAVSVNGPQNGFYRKADGSIPNTYIVKMKELFANECIADETSFDMVNMTPTEQKKFALTSADLLFGRRSLVVEGAGKCRRVGDIQLPLAFESSLLRITLDTKKVLPRYVQAWFDTDEGRQAIMSIRAVTTISGIKGSDLKKVVIPVPTMEQQERFLSFVRQSDKSKFELEQALSELNATYKRIIAENLG